MADYKPKFTFVFKIRFTIARFARSLSVGFLILSNSLIILLSASFLFATSECFAYSKSCRYEALSTRLMGRDYYLGLIRIQSPIESSSWPCKSVSWHVKLPGNFAHASLMLAVRALNELVKSPPFCVLINFVLFDLHFEHFPFSIRLQRDMVTYLESLVFVVFLHRTQ